MIKKRNFPIKKAVICLAALTLILAAAFFARSKFFSRSKIDDERFTVTAETFSNVIEIAGTISAAKEQKLQAAGIGTVMEVFVKEGDKVRSGDIILRLDDTEQRYNLERHDYEMAQKQVSGAPRELRLMRVQREVMLQRIRDRQIIANFDGVIAEFTTSVGDVFEAKDPVGVIINRSYLTATVEVAETDAPKLKTGQNVTLKFPAFAGRNIEGRVHSFPAVATKSSRGASVVKAEIRIDNPPDEILPNYSFTGEIEIGPPENLLLVNRRAIGRDHTAEQNSDNEQKNERDNEQGRGRGGTGRRGVMFAEKMLEDGSFERVEVRIAPYSGEFVKVISGISEGDVLKAQEQPPISGAARGGSGQGGQGNQGRGQFGSSQSGQNRRPNTGPVIMMPR